MSIPEVATEMIEKIDLSKIDETSRTLFLVGSSNVGKTTLLFSFFDKSDTPHETLVLEYSFGRKSNQKQGVDKSICHIWEYGGKLDTLRHILRSIPIKGLHYYCIMVDLSKIKTLWNTLELCIQAMKESNSDVKDKAPEIILLGGKYDLYKNYDAEIKKIICTTLRSIAVLLEAHLMFYSSKETSLGRRAKEMLHGLSFGNGISLKEKITHVNKPLSIPKGSDTWDSIGVQPSTLEQIKARHLARIQTESGVAPVDELVLPQITHAEPVLDSKVTSIYDNLKNNEFLDISITDYLSGLQI
ncbi:hypothetical protein ACJJTC_009161 [Scirpophaga incertulas]